MKNLVVALFVVCCSVTSFATESSQWLPKGLYQGPCSAGPDVKTSVLLLNFEPKNNTLDISGSIETHYKNGEGLVGDIMSNYKVASGGALSSGYSRGGFTNEVTGQCAKQVCWLRQLLTLNGVVNSYTVSLYSFNGENLSAVTINYLSNGKNDGRTTQCNLVKRKN